MKTPFFILCLAVFLALIGCTEYRTSYAVKVASTYPANYKGQPFSDEVYKKAAADHSRPN